MDAPSLSLLPPTPSSSPFDPSPSPSLTVSSVPDLASSSQDRERSSTETTIFTIYSMYGDDEAKASWSASAFEDKSQELDLSLGDSFTYQNFFNHTSAYTKDPDCTDTPSNPQQLVEVTNSRDTVPRPGTSHDLSPLPLANNATSSTNGRETLEPPPRSLRASPSSHRSRSATSSCSSQADSDAISPPVPLPTPPQSRPPSALRRTDSPLPGPVLILTPPQPTSSLVPPHPSQSPSPSPTTKQHSSSNPSSKTSLVPSDGEDLDAFHVRSTYAKLEATGVKGDGYEEGVERTRARQRFSHGSELRAGLAVGGPSEKLRELSPEEVNVLSSLDRYGFFSVPSHDRLIRLPAAPLFKRLSSVTAGPKTAPNHAVSVSSLPPLSSPVKEAARIAKWGRMLEVRNRDRGGNVQLWGVKVSKVSKLRRRVYKGIPDRWRSAAWEVLVNTFSRSGLEQVADLRECYRQDLEKPSSYDIQIDLDVPRTIGGHVLFRTRYGAGQRSLFHVLHSFSLRCSQCGYVQGMGPIAATLLCYFEPERVYVALTRLHDAYLMHAIFSPGFPGLLEAIYIQERLMQLKMPDVYAAFKKHMISTTSYATKWYITLFSNSVPFQTQLRLWDAFLLDGQDVFVAVAVAIVWVYRDHITSSSANFETVLSLLSSFFVPEDEDALLSWVEQLLSDKKLRAQMKEWRHDWAQLVASGKDGSALL